ncbi:hypothetical protein [Halalkalibacter krulwichiae]|uniref:Uncharacterized protein n=1 Tax=Halalkalibacter krulwichiae TaxID=199441 RepID=A0A1X9MGG8_9BACI|nr:hypothetical protein [Halalkalibacter krulwichiae]ARK32565.1 hypothetical protein BkAM31D_23340 [Halalkalibacter krulwichiae]
MNVKTRTIITLVCSLLIFAVGVIRILTESLASTPLFVAYIFVMTGLIGAVANGMVLRKLRKTFA